MPKPDTIWTGSWVKTYGKDGMFNGWKWVAEKVKSKEV